MAINTELRISDGTTYAGDNNVIYLRTIPAMVKGLLGSDGKFKSDLIPAYLMGGMKYVSTINAPVTTQTHWDSLMSSIDSWLSSRGVIKANEEMPDYWNDHCAGKYFVAGSNIIINPVSASNGHMFVNQDAGHETGDHTLEAGDWLIYNHYDTGTSRHYWGVVNNTYQDATIADRGVVKLASEQDGVDGTGTTQAMTPKATVAAINQRAYTHPLKTVITDIAIPLTGKKVISDVNVDAHGHITEFKTRDITLADLGYTGATNANYYVHPDFSEIDNRVVASDETISYIEFNNGHPIEITTQKIRSGTESQSGLLQLATSSESKTGTVSAKATSPARVKEMIAKFAMIPITAGTSLPTDMTDHPEGKLILLRV